ncbi:MULTISPECIES: hypothetical protein [Vibrio]|uniref:Pentapeptide MXKDX repeat protein n=1 Tax=Vibrio ostreae TaxID=2841925 RepID=A0A975U576_9VIBR|nr:MULTISPECIES: hypothetical protein [Vibrio]QXO15430.1 hypothetical protein KNV97_03060 [Vibrio ostreae]WGY45371.1 hypothetical protein J0X00_00485 [Vibrio sp. ABG19]
MKNVTSVMLLGLVLGFSASAMANHHKQGENMMSDSAKQNSQGMMMSDQEMDQMHKDMMGMSEEERAQYKMKLQDCEKSGRSAKECEAKLERHMDRDDNKDKMMDQDKMMKQDKKSKTY